MYDSSTYRYLQQNVIVPNVTPFCPSIIEGEGAETMIAFNQGYIFNYQDIDLENGTVKKIKVEECSPKTFTATGKFFVKIIAPEGKITSAIIVQEANGSEVFHYSAKNLPNGGDVYLSGQGEFFIPICEFDDNGNLKAHHLRENIHWQKTNYESVGEGEQVLYSWGDSVSQFADGSVKFRSCVAGSGILITPSEDAKSLVFSIDSGYFDGSSSTGDSGGDSSGSSKTAIIPFHDEYVGLACMEGSEAWFFDIIDVEVESRNSYLSLPEELISSCEEESLEVLSIHGVDKPCKATGSIISGKLNIKIHNFFAPKTVKIFLYGIRKGHRGKYKRYTEGQFRSNNKFYASAHRG